MVFSFSEFPRWSFLFLQRWEECSLISLSNIVLHLDMANENVFPLQQNQTRYHGLSLESNQVFFWSESILHSEKKNRDNGEKSNRQMKGSTDIGANPRVLWMSGCSCAKVSALGLPLAASFFLPRVCFCFLLFFELFDEGAHISFRFSLRRLRI